MELGPLSVVVGWEALVLAVIIYAIMHALKTALTIIAGENKIQQKWVKGVALPIMPLLLGAIGGLVYPFYPEMILTFAQKSPSPVAVYAVWGMVIGQFSDYLNSRATGLLKMKEKAPDA